MDYTLHPRLPTCGLFGKQTGDQDAEFRLVDHDAETDRTDRNRVLHFTEEVQPGFETTRVPPRFNVYTGVVRN